LLQALCDAGHEVSLETGGAMDMRDVDPRVSRVMDLKTPASGEMHRNLLANIALLRLHDQVKFVICDEADYHWAVSMLREHELEQRVADVLFSPVHATLPARQLADWIVRDRLPVRFQIQLHKFLWDDARGK
jgi:7-carboxy-7-deazaguanine synthase